MVTRPIALRPTGAATSAPGGLVAWWKLDEAAGRQALDSVGNRNPGQAHGQVSWQPGGGRLGGALLFEGPNARLDCGDSPDFDLNNSVTVALWVKPRDFQRRPQTLAAKGGAAWRLGSHETSGRLAFSVDGPQRTGRERNQATRVFSSKALVDDQWHHVAGVYDGKRIALYVNGELQESINASGFLSMNNEPLWVGNNPASHGESFEGWLEDVRLYERGLSEAEVKAIYRRETATRGR